MEFIPLERYSEKSQKKSVRKRNAGINNKLVKDETNEKMIVKKIKPKFQGRVSQKKSVKNKYKETFVLKNKKRIPQKRTLKEEKEEEIEVDESICRKEKIVVEDQEEEKKNEEQEFEKNSEEEAFKKKCKEMNEKKKNRLFVKLKKKISSEAQIKELHPDIRSVIFPRKKNSRWCWAVFASEERADEVFKQLVKNKEVFVSKPNPYDKVDRKLKEKLKTTLRKKEIKKKLQKMWM